MYREEEGGRRVVKNESEHFHLDLEPDVSTGQKYVKNNSVQGGGEACSITINYERENLPIFQLVDV